MGIYQYYKDAPPAGKIVIIGVGALAAIAGYYAIRNTLQKIQHQKELKGQRLAVDDAKDTVKALAQQGQNYTYPDAQYSAWSSAIQTSFQGCDPFNDDVGAVANAINGARNDADIYKLIATFGVRKWDECGWGTGDAEADLVGGVRNELSQDEINMLNNILRNKGIVFHF